MHLGVEMSHFPNFEMDQPEANDDQELKDNEWANNKGDQLLQEAYTYLVEKSIQMDVKNVERE